jgi:hypothetical protein
MKYIIRKIVEAQNAEEAIEKSKRKKIYDIQVLAEEKVAAKDAIGFDCQLIEEDD